MTKSKWLINSDIDNLINIQGYLNQCANSSLFEFNDDMYSAQLSSPQTHEEYSAPIVLGNLYNNNSGSLLSKPLSTALAYNTATLVGSACGLQINLIGDSSVSTAASTFQTGIIQAAQLLCNAISNGISLNIKISYAGTGGCASGGPTNGAFESYSTVRANLISHEATGDTTFNALPIATSIQGQSQVFVENAQLKLWGLQTSNNAIDGVATFSTDSDPSMLIPSALHELTHAMGRVPYRGTDGSPNIFDLFRFTAPGTYFINDAPRIITMVNPTAQAYFSLDGGKTNLANYDTRSDISDFQMVLIGLLLDSNHCLIKCC